MTGKFTFGEGESATQVQPLLRQQALSLLSAAIWFLTQMRLWGQITETSPPVYLDLPRRLWSTYNAAAKSLVADGKAPADAFPETDGFRAYTKSAIDKVPFDARKPTAYISSFSIGLKPGQTVTPAGVK